MIDRLAYGGVDARLVISEKLHKVVQKSGARVLDMCCGVGMSTRALQSAFQDAEAVIGVDTSPEMIAMARVISNNEFQFRKQLYAIFKALSSTKFHMNQVRRCISTYVRGNAERTKFPARSFDLVTIMYAFHEAPKRGRYLMLREARRLLQNGGTLALVDISPEYKPSPTMLAGEPYVLEYQQNIKKQVRGMTGFTDVQYIDVIPGHVVMWLLTRDCKNGDFKKAAIH
mmetsp:Transcript_42056/g.61695  ORF Transcript_42056/g.61695 Transcript_42056/m.61695 type:complete len:228 (+) Transcript_42056:508-1191(+)